MSKIDDAIKNTAYIFDVLRAYREIINSGSCNDCICVKNCEYAPQLGRLVRYNCPHYRPKIRREVMDCD